MLKRAKHVLLFLISDCLSPVWEPLQSNTIVLSSLLGYREARSPSTNWEMDSSMNLGFDSQVRDLKGANFQRNS
jgi:hypothetical protein